jgi:hypothetical protein
MVNWKAAEPPVKHFYCHNAEDKEALMELLDIIVDGSFRRGSNVLKGLAFAPG